MIKKFTNEYQMYKNEKGLEILEISNGIILPRKYSEEAPNWGLGGVCDQENVFVKTSEYHGGWAEHGGVYNWGKEEYIDEEVIYFGLFFNHWGHFLVDLIGRLWYYVKNNVAVKYKLAYIGEDEPGGNFCEFFELLGIRSEQLIHVTVPTRFRKVVIPEVSCRPCIWYTKEFQSIFDSIVDRVKKTGYIPVGFEKCNKVYFSRLGFKKAQNTEVGEKLIARWLEINGYQLISPEKLSLRDQIYIWNHAKEIVCLNGTIPINVAFSQNSNLKLIVLNKTSLVHKNLDLFLLMRKCNVSILDVYYEPFKKYPKSIGEGPFLIHITKDIEQFSQAHHMDMPFSRIFLRKEFVLNYVRLVWCIWNLKGRIRMITAKLCPVFIKEKIRKVVRK